MFFTPNLLKKKKIKITSKHLRITNINSVSIFHCVLGQGGPFRDKLSLNGLNFKCLCNNKMEVSSKQWFVSQFLSFFQWGNFRDKLVLDRHTEF